MITDNDQGVYENCRHYQQRNTMVKMKNTFVTGASCTHCEHFDERRQHCRLNLYDPIPSGFITYYFQ